MRRALRAPISGANVEAGPWTPDIASLIRATTTQPRHNSLAPPAHHVPPRPPRDPIAIVLEIGPGDQRQLRIVAQVAAADVAGAAKEPAHLAGLVVVVDVEVALDLALAHPAAPVLPLEDRVVFLDGEAVIVLELVLALALAAILALLELARRIVVPLLAALGVDALLVGRVPGPIVGAGVLPVRFVLGIALPAARVVIGVGTHDMAILGKGAQRRSPPGGGTGSRRRWSWPTFD
jgi:hypothetical protein